MSTSTTEQSVTGQDGSLTVTAANTVVNQYAVLAADVAAGATSITVTDITDFGTAAPFSSALATDDLLMLYQPGGATINTNDDSTYGTVTVGGAGRYELVHVTAVVGNTITIESTCGGLENAYTIAGRTQVIRVLQPTTLTISGTGSITAQLWDGARGGVVAIWAQSTASIGGAGINVNARGFRGGAVSINGTTGTSVFRSADPLDGAEKGESIAGFQLDYDNNFQGRYGRGAPANGGGGGDADAAPGGGGANGNSAAAYTGAGVMDNGVVGGSTAWPQDPEFISGSGLTTSSGGGRGGYSQSSLNGNAANDPPDDVATWGADGRRTVGGRGGHPLANDPSTRLFLGGGGGAGATSSNLGGAGGRGGGLVFLVADTVSGTNVVQADGANGGNSTGEGPGGGGAGGSIVIKANSITQVTLHADGGDGGNHAGATDASGGGGGGGGGFIAISTGTVSRSVVGGAGGTTNNGNLSEFPTNGATRGDDGQTNSTIGVVPVCTPVDLSITKTNGVASSTPGTSTTYTIVATNNGDDTVAGATVTDTFPGTLSGVSWTCTPSAQSTCSAASGTGNISVPVTLKPGGTATFVATGNIAANATGNLNNTASIAAPPGVTDPVAGNNSALDTDTLAPSADLSIAIADNVDPVNAGANVTYTVNVTNTGPSNAATLTMTSTLPAGSTFVSATNANGWTCVHNAGIVTCTRASLAVAAAPAIAIVVTAPASGPLTNDVTIAATTTDPDPSDNSDSETTAVTERADLAVTITDSPDPVVAAGTLTYTVNVTNNGPSTAQSVTLTDTLPASVTFVSATGTGWTCNQSGVTVTCTRATLAASTSAPVTIVVTAGTAGATITNTASVTTTTVDPVAGNNSDSEQTTVTASADLSISITDSPDPVTAGGTLTYTIIVSNAGPSTATTLSMSHALPAGASFVSATGTGWACSQAAGTVTCTRASQGGGAAPTITVVVNAPANGGTANSTATISAATADPDANNNSDTTSTTVTASANLAIAVTDAPDPVGAGATLTYTVNVSNAGPSTAATLTMTDTLPAGVVFGTATGTGWVCTETGGVVTCTRAALVVGNAPAITITVTAPDEATTLSNTATIVAVTADPVAANNTDSDNTTVNARADLSITKTDSPDPVATGGTLTYTIDVANAGPSTATSLTMTDTLPASVTFVSATGTGWVCTQVGVTVTCTRASLAPGAAPPITIVVTAPLTVGTITNTATIASTTSDPVAANNSATEQTTVTPVTDLTLTLADSPDPVEAGATLVYTIDVSNLGPITATSVSVVDTLPAGVTFVSAIGTGWTCSAAGQVVTCTRPSVALGAAPQITITVTPTAVDGTVLDNSATVSCAFADPNLANNTANTTTLVIDREIDVTAITTFPDTFRNPGANAPVRPVTVTNTGMATLHVTNAVITGDPFVWTLVDTNPQDIPPGASFDYLVRFTPTSYGAQPTGTLTLTSDDRSEPMTEVTFSGTGIDRNVAFVGTPRLNLGFTGVGVPVTVNEALVVQSMNATTGFTIARIEIVDADPACLDTGMTSNAAVFTILDPPLGTELPMSARQPYGLTFSAQTPGHYVASARLFIDTDPLPQSTICVEGTASFVDARGGGGCATGGDAGGGALILLAVAFVALRRRRAALTGAIVVVIASSAHADKIVLSIFDPTPATTGINFQLQPADVGAHGTWAVTATISHATDPLVLDASADGQARVIQRSTQVVIGGAYAFGDRFEAGAHMPFYVQDGAAAGDPLMMFTADPASGTAIGDLTMHGRARLWKRGGAAVSAGARLTLPTANADSFTGTEKPSLRVVGMASLIPDTLDQRISLTGNLGAIARAKSRFANLEQGSGLTWGFGVSVRALDRMWFAAELFGELLPSARKESAMSGPTALSPTEWLAGVRFVPDHRINVGIAMGRGLTAAAGSPALRAVVGVMYTPGAPEIRPIKIPKPPKIDGDADGDGIPDSLDKCPNEPEDKDLFDDTDGCPDPDNDKDAVFDVADKCPLDPEDKDGFQDDDGCPDKDNDNDGIPDNVDKCPNEPEDKDGFEDLDGCPDPDNDKDGILDAADKCPNAAETINGNKDDDGCPDAGDSAIVLSPDRIETLDMITFMPGNKVAIAKASFNVLGQVAATMRAHPEIVRLRVTAHVHPSGNYDKDQELSDKRAAAIRDWLVQWGLPAKRVEARGFGSTKPLAPADQKGAQAINERVEMIILERK